jgi:hypothetical protein
MPVIDVYRWNRFCAYSADSGADSSGGIEQGGPAELRRQRHRNRREDREVGQVGRVAQVSRGATKTEEET